MINSAYTPPLDLIRRPRRNRQNAAIRALVRENQVRVDDLIQPLFIKDGNGLPEEIASLPGQSRLNVRNCITEVQELAALGIKAVALFPQIDSGLKDARGKYATIPKNWFFHAIREIKAAVPQVLIVADVALDPYTSHGHDGVLDANGDVANDDTVHILTHYATLLAEAGADIVAPSDMMDGRIGAIRDELDHEGYAQTAILAYAVKFASAYYGPFRDAVGSSTKKGAAPLDKRTYQLDPANMREALLEARLDEDQGADIIMVKASTSTSSTPSRPAPSCPSPPIKSAASTRKSTPPPTPAGSTSSAPATNPSSPSSAPARISSSPTSRRPWRRA